MHPTLLETLKKLQPNILNEIRNHKHKMGIYTMIEAPGKYEGFRYIDIRTKKATQLEYELKKPTISQQLLKLSTAKPDLKAKIAKKGSV